jgi:outer membrane protein assembly factor BamB
MNILTPTIWNNAIFTSSYGGKSILIDVEDNKKPVIRWENKIEAYMSSPLVINDHLYMHLKNKRFACIDLAVGKETWVTKPFGEYWSTLTDGEKILALDQDGTLRLIQSNPKAYTLLSERKVTGNEEESWAHVAVLPQKILIRSQRALTAYRWA